MKQTARTTRSNRAVRWGPAVSLAGLLLLCVSFFLPQVEGCREPVVPAEETASSGGIFLLTWGLPFLFAFVRVTFGGPVSAIRHRRRARRLVAAIVSVICILMLGYGGALMCSWAAEQFGGPTRETITWLSAASLIVMLALATPVVVARCRPEGRLPAATLGCALGSFLYFLPWGTVWGGTVYYGLWVSVAACLVIAVGSGIELLRGPPE